MTDTTLYNIGGKQMKRFTFIILSILLVMTFLAMPVLAAEGEAADTFADTVADVAVIEGEETLPDDSAAVDEPSRYNDLFTRIWEFVVTYQDKIIDIGTVVIILVCSVTANVVQRKKNKKTDANFSSILTTTSSVSDSQNGVVGAVNAMIGGYNNLRESYEKYEGAEDDRNKLVGAVFVQNATILDVLTTVYVNSKNLPQGVKDLVNIKYAKCLKALDDDEKLRACVEAVKGIINQDEVIAPPAESTEGTEKTEEAV